MTSPLVSLCIPTYNRSRYLRSLLDTLTQQLAGFPYPYELVISDNASTDDTPQLLARYAARLPIRAIRQSENIGCFPNVQFVMTQAQGRYMIYLSDDDCVLGEPLAAAIAVMEADPAIAVSYAPWMLYDLVDHQPQGQFYTVPHDLRIERGQHGEFLNHILRHHIFPEIHIARTDVMQRLMPRINEHAFYAFTQAADYLTQGAVLIRQEPFYVSMTRYFADETRSQAGNEEVEYAWDRYRGGLEYLMARAGSSIGVEERAGFHLRIQQMIAVRMSVALRLRHAQGRDPIDSYTIAMRLKGMGYEQLCPVPMATLASAATLHFLLKDPVLNRGMQRLVCVGDFDRGARDYLKRHAEHPVEFVARAPKEGSLANALLFISDQLADYDPGAEERRSNNLNVVRERDLCERFGLTFEPLGLAREALGLAPEAFGLAREAFGLVPA